MSVVRDDLWGLTFGRPHIDADELAAAVEREAGHELDERTRLLIHDSLDALARHWGQERFDSWLASSARNAILEEISRCRFDEPGFPSLHQRIMEATRPEVIRQFLRDLGDHLTHGARIEIGGAIALILAGELSRSTEDIDVADAIPQPIRDQHQFLDELAQEYGLRLTHFQSHYLPAGWADRLTSLGQFGRLDVFLVDPLDIMVGKLFSARRKDLSDLRDIAPRFDKGQTVERVRSSATALLREPDLAQNARRNWYIVFGDELPS